MHDVFQLQYSVQRAVTLVKQRHHAGKGVLLDLALDVASAELASTLDALSYLEQIIVNSGYMPGRMHIN